MKELVLNRLSFLLAFLLGSMVMFSCAPSFVSSEKQRLEVVNQTVILETGEDLSKVKITIAGAELRYGSDRCKKDGLDVVCYLEKLPSGSRWKIPYGGTVVFVQAEFLDKLSITRSLFWYLGP